jgi:hypothetical protein
MLCARRVGLNVNAEAGRWLADAASLTSINLPARSRD